MSQPQYSYPPPPAEPTFEVTTIKHTGVLAFWMNQRFTTRGTYTQCEAAIDAAQQHCILAGWWSFVSILLNPISLAQNATTRKNLRLQAQQAHEYAVWWAAYHGGGVAQSPVWTPPARSHPRKWWVWLPVAAVGSLLALFIVRGAMDDHPHHRHTDRWAPAPTLSSPAP